MVGSGADCAAWDETGGLKGARGENAAEFKKGLTVGWAIPISLHGRDIDWS